MEFEKPDHPNIPAELPAIANSAEPTTYDLDECSDIPADVTDNPADAEQEGLEPPSDRADAPGYDLPPQTVPVSETAPVTSEAAPEPPETVVVTKTEYDALQTELAAANNRIAELEENLRVLQPSSNVEASNDQPLPEPNLEPPLPRLVGGLVEYVSPADAVKLFTPGHADYDKTASEIITPIENRGELDAATISHITPYLEAFHDTLVEYGETVRWRDDQPHAINETSASNKYLAENGKRMRWTETPPTDSNSTDRHVTYDVRYLPAEKAALKGKPGAKDFEMQQVITTDVNRDLLHPRVTIDTVNLRFTHGELQTVEHAHHPAGMYSIATGVIIHLGSQLGLKPTITKVTGAYGEDSQWSSVSEYTLFYYNPTTNSYEPSFDSREGTQPIPVTEAMDMLRDALAHIPNGQRRT